MDCSRQWAAIVSISGKLGCSPQTLHNWVAQAGRDNGERSGPTSEERERIKLIEREVKELRQANEILRKASAYFAQAEFDRPFQTMIAFIDDHCDAYGVEPICRVLPIAPSTYYDHIAKRHHPETAAPRVQRDAILRPEIKRVFNDNHQVYGAEKVWRQMQHEGFGVARCTVERLMKDIGLQGVRRGKKVRTTVPDTSAPCPSDKVNRNFRASAPNRLWVSDFTYVSTWAGIVYVAFIIDVFARRIVGWRISRTAHAGFVLDALEQALHARRPVSGSGLVHHSDRGSQYLSIEYTERLPDAGLEPSVGNIGDYYDNALAETIYGLYKAEVIHRKGPWKSMDAVEYATLIWVDWFNNRRLLRPIGHIPPAEAEASYYAALKETAIAA